MYIFYYLQYEKNKSYCEDLTEGKFSFPLIHGVLTDRKDNQILNILSAAIQIYAGAFIVFFFWDGELLFLVKMCIILNAGLFCVEIIVNLVHKFV